jgi:hypothetical protein
VGTDRFPNPGGFGLSLSHRFSRGDSEHSASPLSNRTRCASGGHHDGYRSARCNAADIAIAGSAPVLATHRAVKVDAFNS